MCVGIVNIISDKVDMLIAVWLDRPEALLFGMDFDPFITISTQWVHWFRALFECALYTCSPTLQSSFGTNVTLETEPFVRDRLYTYNWLWQVCIPEWCFWKKSRTCYVCPFFIIFRRLECTITEVTKTTLSLNIWTVIISSTWTTEPLLVSCRKLYNKIAD